MRQAILAVAAACTVFLGVSVLDSVVSAQGSDIQRGKAINPVPLNTKGLNPALVAEGSYIVNAHGGCNDCHTNPSYAPGGDPFAGEPEQINTTGYLAGGTVFGPFTSRNLTPRAPNRLPAGLTLAQFLETMQTGRDIKERHLEISPLLQVMPWPVYGKMSERELEAIYEYLRAIPCIGSVERCGA